MSSRKTCGIMKLATSAAMLSAAIFCLSARLALAGEHDLQNSQIDIAYIEPSNASYRTIYEQLKARRVLEELRAFLAPLQLPRKVLIKLEQCNQPDRLFEPGGPVTICYEYVARLKELAAKIPANAATPRGVSRDDAIVGGFIQASLQRTASAVFDVMDVPVWGREQDAADKVAAFLMLQFGSETARKLLNGAAYFFEASDRTWSGSDFSDVRSPDAQRFYNYLCVAYGGDPRTFSDFVEGDRRRSESRRLDLLPESRARRCEHEYKQLTSAFMKTIMPNVNQDLLQVVLATNWLEWGKGK
jgi:hypothetical protein